MVVEVHGAIVVGQHADRGEVVDRNAEEAMHLRSMERHGEHPSDASSLEEVGDETAANRDPGCVLLV